MLSLIQSIALMLLNSKIISEILKIFWFLHYFRDEIFITPFTHSERGFTEPELERISNELYGRRDEFDGDSRPRFNIEFFDRFLKVKIYNNCVQWIIAELTSIHDFGPLLITSKSGLPRIICRSRVNYPGLVNDKFLTCLGSIAEKWHVLNINQVNPEEYDVTFQTDANGYKQIRENNILHFGHSTIEISLVDIEYPRIMSYCGMLFEQPEYLCSVAFLIAILIDYVI